MSEVNTKALEEAVTKFNEVGEKINSIEEQSKTNSEQLDELKNEIANLQTKPSFHEETKTQDQLIEEADFGVIFQKFCNSSKAERADGFEVYAAKMLNLDTNNPEQGANAIAEYLDRSILKRAVEMSPLLQSIGSRTITRDMRRLVTTKFPTVSDGFERIQGAPDWEENDTPETGEIRSKVFKRQGRYRLTDEAYYGADINLYADMMSEIASAEAMWLANMMLYGTGEDKIDKKTARGILTQRVKPWQGEESHKGTYGYYEKDANGDFVIENGEKKWIEGRDLDVFPVKLTGGNGKLGKEGEGDAGIVNFLIDLIHSLPNQYRGNARFYMNDLTLAELKKVRDANERPIFADYQDGSIRILGRPVVLEPLLPKLTTDAICIAYGDLSQGVFLSRGAFTKTVIDEVTTPGQIIINRSEEYYEMGGANDCIIFGMASATEKPRPPKSAAMSVATKAKK